MHNEIVHAFLQTHPEECAREIEHFSLDDMLFFIKSLSKKECVSLISCLIPSISAVCLQNLPIENSKSIIKELSLDVLKKILPRIPDDLRAILIAELDKNQQFALQHALQFSDQTVGAFMNTHILFLPVELTVAQTVSLIREFSEEITPWIFCIDNNSELQGMITLKTILSASHTQIIGHIMQDCPLVLSPDTAIQSIAFDNIWETQTVLPVTNEQQILIGALEYHSIVTQIQSLMQSDRKENLVDSFAHIMFMFSHTTEDILTEVSQLTATLHHREK